VTAQDQDIRPDTGLAKNGNPGVILLKDIIKSNNRAFRLSEQTFKNNDANKYQAELVQLIGKPTYQSNQEVGWISPKLPKQYGSYTMNITEVDKVWVIDESIPHNFPVKHRDFAYTQYAVPAWQQNEGTHKVDPTMIADFAKVTGSIIIDPLKGTVTARCGDLVANDKTIQFVLDVIDGKAQPSKQEYANRILDKND
jgi:hypothetical protein